VAEERWWCGSGGVISSSDDGSLPHHRALPCTVDRVALHWCVTYHPPILPLPIETKEEGIAIDTCTTIWVECCMLRAFIHSFPLSLYFSLQTLFLFGLCACNFCDIQYLPVLLSLDATVLVLLAIWICVALLLFFSSLA
jgi:hypothetical protein